MSALAVKRLQETLEQSKSNPANKVYVIPVIGGGDIHALSAVALENGVVKLKYGGYGLEVDTKCGDWIKAGPAGEIHFSSDGEGGVVLFGTEAQIISKLSKFAGGD